jgi:ABC-type multidrug transport system fused ATPase/permease subunit
MRYVAKPMVWGTIFLVFALLIVMGYLCYVSAKRKQDDQPDDADDNAVQAQLGLAYFLFLCAFIFLCVIIFLRKKIKLAVAIMEEASDAIGDMPGLIFFPILIFIFLGGFFVYWISAACYLMSASDPDVEFDSRDSGDSRSRPTEVDFVINKDLRYMLIYHFFGLLWTVGWILAVMFLSIAIAVAVWFFKREEMPTSPVTKAFSATCGNHLGTAAFGSFIIAVVQLIRFLIIVFHEKVEKFGEGTPCQPCVKCLICYCECCLAYLERFLQFISKNAYVQTAMRGKSFCPAAKQAWNTIMANVMRLGTVNFVAEFLTFCGKLLIVAATCCLAFYLTDKDWAIQGGDADELNSPLLIVFIVFIIAWYVSELFMHVYESTVLCLVYCFLYDEDKFEGAHCSERLRKFCEDNDDGDKKKKEKKEKAKEKEDDK